MEQDFLHNLIELIVAEVLRRVAEQSRQEQRPQEVLVLLVSPVAYPQELRRLLSAQFGVGYTPVSFVEGCGLEDDTLLLHAADMTQAELMQRVTAARCVVLVGPKLELLQQIAAGSDRDPLAHLLVRSILWKKDVRLYLDFEPPKFRRNTFLEGVAASIETLRQMDVTICPYYLGDAAAQTGLTLVTEADVQAAASAQEPIRCRVGAIITPAARDALLSSGVSLQYEGEAPCN